MTCRHSVTIPVKREVMLAPDVVREVTIVFCFNCEQMIGLKDVEPLTMKEFESVLKVYNES